MIYEDSIKQVVLVEPQARINNAAVTVASVDRSGFDYAVILAYVGANDVGFTTFKLQEADDNATWTDVSGADYSLVATLPGNTANVIYTWEVDLKARKRYLRPAITVGNGTAGMFLTIVATLGRAKLAPATPAAKGYQGVLTL
jgi:hypothetical protein